MGAGQNPLCLELTGVAVALGRQNVLDDLSMSVREGEIVGVIGPNGAGKTTLVNVIGGTIKPSRGTVRFRGRDVTGWPPHRISRAGIARTFQVARPFPEMTASENVTTGLRFGSAEKSAAGQWDERAMELLKLMHLCAKAGVRAKELTFSELRKLEVARALATGPRLLLLDEIAAGLSPQAVDESAELVLALRDRGLTMLIIDHFLNLTARVSDRLVALHHGRVIAEGKPNEVLENREVIAAYFGKHDRDIEANVYEQ